MDGVITDTMPYHFRAWKTIFTTIGIHVSHEDIYKREGQKGIDSVYEIFREKGKTCSDVLARELLKKKERTFKRILKRRFIRGSRLLISRLRSSGYRLALVTGTSRHEAKELLPEYLWNSFEVIVSGSEVKNGKPHPEPYVTALSRLKLKSSRAVVIENAPFGIASAKAAGLQCVALETSLPKKYLRGADAVFNSYASLQKIF